MSVTSEEINFLVYRYLQESGFTHTAFSFFNESTIPRSNINGANVPPGALISLIQRGLQYKEMETHLNEDGTEVQCKVPFSAVTPHICKLEDPSDEMTDIDEDSIITDNLVSILRGHTDEVFICSWNPKKDILASGSADTSARIWKINSGPGGKVETEAPVLLSHSGKNGASKDESVTTLDWDPTGCYLATGAYNGIARIWDSKGNLKQTLNKHEGPIFSLKWNNQGNYLLSGSADKTAIVWDTNTGEMKQQFFFHTAPTLEVDWKDNNAFATCSSDYQIYVGEVGKSKYIKCFKGHQNEVNAITWCPAGKLLASCSDDFTAKVWSLDSQEPLQDFKEHKKELYTIKWSPTGPGSSNPNKDLVLASASFDATIKLWNVEVGKCLYSLSKHTSPIYSVSFSPDGQYLASGSFDHYLYIWSVQTGEIVKTYKGGGGIFEVCWSRKGDKIAASFDTNNLVVVDFRM